jgi:hypothetical protein
MKKKGQEDLSGDIEGDSRVGAHPDEHPAALTVSFLFSCKWYCFKFLYSACQSIWFPVFACMYTHTSILVFTGLCLASTIVRPYIFRGFFSIQDW